MRVFVACWRGSESGSTFIALELCIGYGRLYDPIARCSGLGTRRKGGGRSLLCERDASMGKRSFVCLRRGGGFALWCFGVAFRRNRLNRQTNGRPAGKRIANTRFGRRLRWWLPAAAGQGNDKRANNKRPQAILPKGRVSPAILAVLVFALMLYQLSGES